VPSAIGSRVREDCQTLHLSLDEGHGPEAGHQHVGTAYLYVEDADSLYEEWARPGVGGLTRRVGDTPYQLREGSHVDPDGNLIRFGSPMPGRPGERLRAHLETRYGIAVDAVTELDLGVWRVGRADGPDWVARWFPARRTISNGLFPGLAGVVKTMAGELGPAGIRVNGLLPVRIATDRVRELDALQGDPDEVRARLSEHIPLRRYGEPEEFGRAAAFVLSPAASYITGAMIPVDGGAISSI
jgi:Enoyl-(Acyl carrier protein) reductase